MLFGKTCRVCYAALYTVCNKQSQRVSHGFHGLHGQGNMSEEILPSESVQSVKSVAATFPALTDNVKLGEFGFFDG